MKQHTIILLCVLLSGSTLQAQVLAQWRGDGRNGIYNEANLLESWPEEGPPLLWTAKVKGAGYSSASVATDMIYLTGILDTLEYVSAYGLSGELQLDIPQ
jgi:hypothetical protein